MVEQGKVVEQVQVVEHSQLVEHGQVGEAEQEVTLAGRIIATKSQNDGRD